MLESCVGKKIELYTHTPKDDKECVCEFCKGTGYVIRDGKWLEECAKCNQGIVPKCEYCGKPKYKKVRYGSFEECDNPHCIIEREHERNEKEKQNELDRFNKATKWTWDNVPKDKVEFLYHDLYSYGDGYFSDIDELREYCQDEDIEMPKYVYCTTPIEFSLDAWDLIESRLEEAYEGAEDNVNEDALVEFQEHCNEFVKKQNGRLDSYCVDYKNVVLL